MVPFTVLYFLIVATKERVSIFTNPGILDFLIAQKSL